MDNSLQVFSGNGFSVRITSENGEIWFVAKDIAEALDYSEATISANMSNLFGNVPEMWKGNKRFIVSSANGVEQTRDMLCVTEQGLYFFLGRSDKPKALPYQMWIAGDVVPSIRKTGSYTARQNTVPVDPIAGARIVFEAAGIKDNQLALALDRVYMTYTGASALEAGQITLEAPTKEQPDISDEVKYVSVSNNETDMRFMEMGVKNSELRLKGAEILFELLKEPPVQMNDDCKTLITYEIFSLASGHDYLETLTQYHSRTDENAQ